MKADDIKEKLYAYFSQECGINKESIEANQPIFSTGLLDSIELIKLISFIDKEIGVTINPLDIGFDEFDTIDRIVANIENAAAPSQVA